MMALKFYTSGGGLSRKLCLVWKARATRIAAQRRTAKCGRRRHVWHFGTSRGGIVDARSHPTGRTTPGGRPGRMIVPDVARNWRGGIALLRVARFQEVPMA